MTRVSMVDNMRYSLFNHAHSDLYAYTSIGPNSGKGLLATMNNATSLRDDVLTFPQSSPCPFRICRHYSDIRIKYLLIRISEFFGIGNAGTLSNEFGYPNPSVEEANTFAPRHHERSNSDIRIKNNLPDPSSIRTSVSNDLGILNVPLSKFGYPNHYIVNAAFYYADIDNEEKLNPRARGKIIPHSRLKWRSP